MFYGSQIWDPVLIIAQIVTIQCLFYITYGLLLWILVGPYVTGHLTVTHFFGSSWLSLHSFVSWMDILANLCNAIPLSFAILLVVERAKKCLDFSATAFLLHFAACCIFAGFPKTGAWWLANGAAFMITAVLSEWLCLRRELRDIPMGGLGNRRKTNQGGELLPLSSQPTQPSSNSPGASKPASLLSRMAASMSSQGGSGSRDNVKIANEV